MQARSGYSLAQQIEALREYAAHEGYEVLEEVANLGQSGASLERPGMNHIWYQVAAGGVSVVLTQDRDRFAREPAYHYLLRQEFEGRGTKSAPSMTAATTPLKASSPTASLTR
jgi:DNA invertase Pin-like site-specific DNA recombinase